MQKGIDKEHESLEKLMQEAELHAAHCLKNEGICAPTLFMNGLTGLKTFHPTGASNKGLLEEIFGVAKLLCIVNEADATVLVSQGEMRGPVSREQSDEEVVLLFADNRLQSQERALPIVRGRDGKFLGFGQARTVDRTGVEGFPRFIQREAPSEALKQEAREILAGRDPTSTKEKVRRNSDAGWQTIVSEKALGQMVSHAQGIASSWLHKIGFCPQTITIWGVEGNFAIERPPPFDQGPDWFDERAKLACQAAGAYGYVFVSEARISRQVPGSDHSKSPRHEDVLFLHGQSREGKLECALPIRRGPDDRFLGFGEPIGERLKIAMNMEFLPKEMPAKEVRAGAKRDLEQLGIRLNDRRIDQSRTCMKCRTAGDDEEREAKRQRGRGYSM